MKKFISSVSIAVLVMLMIVSTVGAANKPDKAKKVKKNALAGKTYENRIRRGDYSTMLRIQFIDKKNCIRAYMNEPPAVCHKGTYVIKDDKTVVCSFGGITYTDYDCTKPWPHRNENGDEIPPEEIEPYDWILTSSDNFETFQLEVFGDQWYIYGD